MLIALKTSLTIAWRSIYSNKLRSLLTLLGVIIGVCAVIGIVSVGEGLKASFISEIGSYGSTIVYVFPKGTVQTGQQYMPQRAEPFNEGDVFAIREEASALEYVIPSATLSAKAKYEDRTFSVQVEGHIPLFFEGPVVEIEEGRAFNERENKGASRVAVIGAKVQEKLIPKWESALGKQIKLGEDNFTVIGVLKEKGTQMTGWNIDSNVLIPLTTFWYRFAGNDDVDYIVAIAKDVTKMDEAKEQIKNVLRKRRKITDRTKDDFELYTTDDFIDFASQFFNTLVMVFGFIAFFALLVGSIGIMNIMLVTVTERTREIGLRMSVGASRARILGQFLMEAMLLTAFGGLIGMLLGWGIGVGVSFWLSDLLNTHFIARLPAVLAIITLLVSCGIGVIAGIYPAYLASQKDPIHAIRYE